MAHGGLDGHEGIQTARLWLAPATVERVEAEVRGREELGRALGARVAADWPPEHWDAGVLRWLLDKACEPGHEPVYGGYYVVLRAEGLLVGTAGFKGPPDAHGVVEIGYGVVPSHQRRGIASEMALGLIDLAWRDARVRRVDAETYPNHEASLGVMRRCGMAFIGPGTEVGTVRWGRARHSALGTRHS